MEYNANKLLFSSISENGQEQEINMDEIANRINRLSGENVTSQEQTIDGKLGYNIHLPSGIDFRLENGVVRFSHFGMTKDEIKQVYMTLNQLGLSNFSFPEDEKDNDFKRNVIEAHREYVAENDYDEVSIGRGTNEDSQQISLDLSNAHTPSDSSLKSKIANMKKVRAEKAAEKSSAKEVHPCVEDISKYMDDHISLNQKYKTRNYKKTPCFNGYKMMWYKDEDQKKEGPKTDKTGKVNPNFEFGLRGEIEYKNDKPTLNVTLLTPKHADASDAMMDEALALAATCKITHMRYNGPVGMKGKFLVSCAKKMIVPTGVSLGPKDFANMMKVTKENVFDLDKRVAYYKRLRAHLREELIAKGIKETTHPYFNMIKDLDTQIALEQADNKYKNFNKFYESSIMAKVYTDTSDVPLNTFQVQKKEDKTNVAKELATGMAYVDLLSLYTEDPRYAKMSKEELHQEYMKLYNKNLYEIHTELRSDFKKLGPNGSEKEKKEIIASKYEEVQSSIQSIQALVSNEGFDKLNVPRLRKFPYYDVARQEAYMINRLRKGRDLHQAEKNAIMQAQLQMQNQGR